MAKENHHKTLCESLDIKDKRLWPKINRIRGGIKSAVQPLIKSDKTIAFKDSEINEVLIEQHVLPPASITQDDSWRTHVDESVKKILAEEQLLLNDGPRTYYNMPFTYREVIKAEKKMEPHSAPGPDGILPIMIQKGHPNLTKAIHHSFNVAFDEGVFPAVLKKENRIYLAKDSKPHYNSSKMYRSISLSSCIGKMYESVSAVRLVSFMDHNGLWDAHQYAYKKNHNLVQCLMYYVMSVLSATHEGKYTATAFIDLEGAYDRVWRNGLIYKLYEAGIRGNLLLMIASFLSGRFARSMANSDVSRWIESILGLPQGSILSPILFIFFILDLTFKIPLHISYADDLSAWSSSESLEECKQVTIDNIQKVEEWCHKWGQSHHKTEVMLHTPSGKHECLIIPGPAGKPLPQATTRKLLGVIIDETFSFQEHIKYIAGKATSALQGIGPIIAYTRSDTSLALCNALVYPHITKTYPIWCATKASIAPLEKVHRSILLKSSKAGFHRAPRIPVK